MAGKAFMGGEALEARLREIAEKVSRAGTVEVGFLEGATYPDGTPVAQVAAMNEFGGAIDVPERTAEIKRSIRADGSFNKNGRFVKASKANFQTSHVVPAHTITIPPRPFFRTMIASKKGQWGTDLAKILKTADYDTAVALARMGNRIAGQLQRSIRDFSEPANAKSTVAKKGFNDPLVDSGHMLNSVDFEVKE